MILRDGMVISVLFLLSVIPLSTAQKCSSKADCKTKYAPHCSKWGYCQWTKVYGTSGKAQGAGLKAGECRSHLDCNIRAPVCSEQGFCTDNGRGEKINRRPKYPVFEPWTQDDNNIDTDEARGISFTTTTTPRPTPRTTTTMTRSSGLGSICKSPNGVFPHPSDCELYYQCHGGSPVLGRCQKGFRWNTKKNYCDWSENVACEKTTKTTTTTTTTTTTRALETFEDIFENEAVSVNHLSYGEENLIRNQRLTVDEPKEGPNINAIPAGPVTEPKEGPIKSKPAGPVTGHINAIPAGPVTGSINAIPAGPVTESKEGPINAIPAGPVTFENIPSPPSPPNPLPPAITSQPVAQDLTRTRAWAPRQAGFRALPAVPGKPKRYQRPVFSLYDAVPKT